MQHPVGSVVNTARGRAELTDFGAVLTNSTAVGAFAHTITACVRHRRACSCSPSARGTWRAASTPRSCRPSLRMALVTVLIASIGVVITGDLQARLMTEQQPMKMAAAEALYDTTAPASFSRVHHRLARRDDRRSGASGVPGVLSFMATGSFDGKVEGINDAPAAGDAAAYGPGDYMPVIPMTYWPSG